MIKLSWYANDQN